MTPAVRRSDRQKQSRLTFTPVSSSPSGPTTRSSPGGLANIRLGNPFSTPQPPRRTSRRVNAPNMDAFIGLDEPSPKRQKRLTDVLPVANPISPVTSPASAKMSTISSGRIVVDDSSHTESGDDVQPKAHPRSRRRILDLSDDDDELPTSLVQDRLHIVSSQVPQPLTPASQPATSVTDTSINPLSASKSSQESSLTELDMARARNQVIAIGSDSESDSKPLLGLDSESENDDDDLSSPQLPPAADDNDSDSLDDDVIVRKRRKRIVTSPEPPHTDAADLHDQDIEDDLEDLDDTELRGTRLRDHRSDQREIRRQRLEEIRKRRAKKNGKHAQSDDGNDETITIESDDDDAEEAVDEAEDEEPVYEYDNLAHNDGYDEDFIVDDEDDPIGVPTEELPFQFSRHLQKSNNELFAYIVEWMVHNKINPAFDRHADIYIRAFDKIGDEVKGQSSSKYKSSAWVQDFTFSLETRPEMIARNLNDIEKLDHDRCDACNRSKHPSSYEITFEGGLYDPDSLDPLEQDDGDASERDAKGRSVPAAGQSFFVGKFCYENAAVAHLFEHWKFRLNDWLMDYLTNDGLFQPNKVVERSRWTQKKLHEFADEVVANLDDSGEIERLYKDFKNDRKAAREKNMLEQYIH